MSALRTTWQVSRPDILYPALGAGTTVTEGMLVVGVYIGDQVAASSLVMQQDVGVPFVQVDAMAFFAASVDVQDGDTLTDLERGTVWQAKSVNTYVDKTIVALKSVKSKAIKVGL